MTRKQRREAERPQNISSPKVKTNSGNKVDLLLVFLYLIIDFIPQAGAIDPMGSQWLYLSVLNLVVIVYIFVAYKDKLSLILKRFSQNALTLAFLGFFVLCGLSFFFALNPIETLVVYARLIITLVAFSNICILVFGRPNAIDFLLQAVVILTLIECIPILVNFLRALETTPVSTLIANMKSTGGNKNVFAASLVIKTPFVMYAVFRYFSFGRSILNILALFVIAVMIFLLNARASYVGLTLETSMFLAFLAFQRSHKGVKKTFIHFASIIIPVVIGLLVSQFLIKGNEKRFAASGYTTLGKRIATLSDHTESSANARLFFWENALKQIKETPLTGIGYGNWKIASVKYEYDFYNDFNYSKHAHNDFIQVAAEAGIITALVFISIFVLALWYTIRAWNSETPRIEKNLLAISFMCLAGYAVDAFFNFPAERPTMQVFFALILALIVAIYSSIYQNAVKPADNAVLNTMVLSSAIILILISVYTTYYTYKSMVVQTRTHFTFGTATKDVTWQDVNPKLPDIPNLAENNIPINDTKAWYLFLAGRNDEALSLLNQDKNANPYSMSKEWLKSTIFTSQGKIDSAHYYSKKGFFQRPRNLSLFNLISRTSVPLKDTITIQRAFDEYHKFRGEPHAWKIYLRSLFAVNYNRSQLIHTADSIAKVYPNDAEIQHTRYFIRAGNAAMKKNFSESLENLLGIMKIYPNDYENLENIGLTYYYMKDYANAAQYFKRVTDAKVYGNGKSEFFLGNCLLELRRKGEACGYLSTAANRNYPMAAILFNKNNCELQGVVPR